MDIKLLFIFLSLLVVMVLEQVRGTPVPYLETFMEGVVSLVLTLTLFILIWGV